MKALIGVLIALAYAVPAIAAQQLLVTDREGRTWVGSTDEPDADPLVLVTPNGPMSIPRRDIASVSRFSLPSGGSCWAPRPAPPPGPGSELFALLAGPPLSVIVSVDAIPGWSLQGGGFSPGEGGAIEFADLVKRLAFHDGRTGGGRWVNEALVTAGYRAQTGTEPTSGGLGLGAGYQVTRWSRRHLGIRFQLVIDETWWQRRGRFHSMQQGGKLVERIDPFTTFGRVGIGLAF